MDKKLRLEKLDQSEMLLDSYSQCVTATFADLEITTSCEPKGRRDLGQFRRRL